MAQRAPLRVDFKGLQRERHGSFLKVFELCEDVPGRATEAAEARWPRFPAPNGCLGGVQARLRHLESRGSLRSGLQGA